MELIRSGESDMFVAVDNSVSCCVDLSGTTNCVTGKGEWGAGAYASSSNMTETSSVVGTCVVISS